MGPAATISEVLADIVAQPGPSISVREIVAALGERGFALLFLVLGLPNCLPMPPPIPLLCGFLLVFVAGQLLVGRRRPWLPERVLDWTVSREASQRLVARAAPTIRRIESIARPRGRLLDSATGLRVVGAAAFVVAVALVLAPPLVGQLPHGLSFCLIGLGLAERDSVVIAIGAAAGLVGVAVSAGFVLAVFEAVRQVILYAAP